MKNNAKIFIVGDASITGSALMQHFRVRGFNNILGNGASKLNLKDQSAVQSFFKKEKPDYVFLTSIKSGGILANRDHPADFIYDNLQTQNNVIHSSYITKVKKLIFFGSSCIYPKDCPQPIKEEYLLKGTLEETSQPYAIAKIAGIAMCQSYGHQYGIESISLIPATIYGPNDNFDSRNSHVISSVIAKIYKAKKDKKSEVVLLGTGKPRREFIYVDDVVDACIFLTNNYNVSEIINVGVGEDISIQELAQLIKDIFGFKGKILFDGEKPDGVMQKLLDSSKITRLGWQPKISLEDGLSKTCTWYKENIE